MNDLTTAFFQIVKSDKNADGTMMVYGKATDDSIDIDQQICDPTWLDSAMPEWFKSGGNIREQHSSIAAGVAKEYEKKADGHYIHALVVDPISVKKVDAGVLKGFSIGIKSPRIVRDEKAANGRIIDGQIVEVSLVDRPANPNCQLVLAKSVAGENGMWKVEELIETAENATEKALDFDRNSTESGKMKTASDLIEAAKSLVAGETVKFDKKLYEDARTALAQLIVVEANEMDAGHNEEMSLAHLLSAVHHLFAWYEGEKAEGEVMEEDSIELSASATEEKSAENKCLECGCHTPEAAHGRTDVSTADMVSPSETPKSAETTETELEEQELPVAEEATEEAPAEEVADEASKEDSTTANVEEEIKAIVEEAVKSATKSLTAEIANLLAAKEAVSEKAVGLETELAAAKSLAVAGGPKRTIKPIDHASNDLLVKAATYKAKADATTDPDLAKGYKSLYEEFLNKAAASRESN